MGKDIVIELAAMEELQKYSQSIRETGLAFQKKLSQDRKIAESIVKHVFPESSEDEIRRISRYLGIPEMFMGKTNYFDVCGEAMRIVKRYRLYREDAYRIAAELEKDRTKAAAQAEKRGKKRPGITQAVAAEIAGVDVKTIRNWERGKGSPEWYPGRSVTVAEFMQRFKYGQQQKSAIQAAKNIVHGEKWLLASDKYSQKQYEEGQRNNR